MIRERLLGERPPGLRKTVDRKRVIGLWLSRLQAKRFMAEAKQFTALVSESGKPHLESTQPPKPSAEPAGN